jgi:RNA 3'-terminal phosphate cyclase (ATP)
LLRIDGSIGGGQVLRSALSLSALTGQPFTIDNIRAKRSRPGLMRQHLTATRAAAEICAADLEGAELGSTRLTFRPGATRGGRYRFVVSGAGSACLVLQTVLPPLLVAAAPSELSFEGGTHNPLAPPYPFLDEVFFPAIERMGPRIERALRRTGFAPAGGGAFDVRIEPVKTLRTLSLHERGNLLKLSAEALVANLPHTVALRELQTAKQCLTIAEQDLALRTPVADGPGNVLMLRAVHEHAVELIAAFGERGVHAERVASRACQAMQSYLESAAPVGEHLSDQLLIPCAMANGGSFSTVALTPHFESNVQVIEQFLPVRVRTVSAAAGSQWRVEISPRD